MKLIDSRLPFYKGNTHTHTTNSDGRKSPEEVMALYKSAGYDFLALTDHWKAGKACDYQGMLILPGVEYDFTFPTQVLHIVCLFPESGMGEGIARGMDHMDVIRAVNSRGGLVIAAHPAWSLNTPDFLATLDGVDISEVYNSVSEEPFNGPRGNSESILDIAAANGKLFSLVASDDSHFYQGEECRGFVMVQAPALTVPALLDSLRQGRFYASQGPEIRDLEVEGDEIRVQTSPVSRITFCSNRVWVGGRCHAGANLTEAVHKIQPGETFVRVQITDDSGLRAWSSPIPVNR